MTATAGRLDRPALAVPAGVGRVIDAARRRPAATALGVAIIAWFALFGTLVWLRHDRYATFDFDLGHHDQAIWLLSRGEGFITVSGMPVLGHHLTLAYFAVVPLYWLGGGPQLLDLLQAAALALSAVPIFCLAKDRLGSDWQALALAGAWLLNPTVQWLCWEAWHPETMAIPFLLTAYLMAARQRWRWYGVFLIAALSWKEDVAIAVAVLGAVFFVRRQRWLGAVTFAIGLAWFAVAYWVVMPHFNGGTNHAGIFYGDLGAGPTDLIRTTFTDPGLVVDRLRANDAIGYGRDLLAPFALTSLLSPLLLLVAVPQFAANTLTTADFFHDIRYHYAAIIVAVLAVASVEGVARLRGHRLRIGAVTAVVAAAVAATVAWGPAPLSTARGDYWALSGNPRQASFDAAVDAVPANASVAATYQIVPHLSHRQQVYTFPNPWIRHNWGVQGVAPDDPNNDHSPAEVDWLVLDTAMFPAGSRERILTDDLLSSGEFEMVSYTDWILVLRRADTGELPPGAG